MAPLIALGRSIVVGFCVASATTDASTANNRGGACTTTTGFSAGPPGSETLSENTGNDSFEDSTGSGCIEDDGDGGGGGGRRGGGDVNTAWTSGETADLDELADRVNDALVAADAELDGGRTALLGSSSSPAARPPGCPGQTTGALSTGCEQEHGGSSIGDGQGESFSSAGGVLVTPVTEESGAMTNQGAEESEQTSLSVPDDAGGDTAVGAEVGEVCGEGEHRRTCSKGEECCNSSCGICAPKGQSCLQIACGGLTRGGGSPKSSLGGATSVSRQSRLRRQKALVSSFSKDGSMPPKDRLQELQLHMPDLFAHVSLKGFKRLIAQVTRPRLETSDNNEATAGARRSEHVQELRAGDRLGASPATTPERRLSQQSAKEEGKGVGPSKNQVPDRNRAQRGQPKIARTATRVHGRKYPNSDSLQLNRSAQGRQQHAAAKVEAGARRSLSAALRSSFDGRIVGGGGGGGEGGDTTGGAAVLGSGDGGGSINPKLRNPETVTGRQQQRHRGVDDSRAEAFLPSGTDPNHPRRVEAARDDADDGRDGSPTSASSSLESNGLSYEDPVGHPVTGLADIDVATTMNGLLDREISEAMKEESDRLGLERAAVIRAAMGLLWKGYSEHAWGYDEVKPLSKAGNNNWGGMGVTLIDSLDTLWLMGLKEEFYNGRDWVRDHLTFDNAGMVSVFETTIRVLGGLLSAFELSRDKVFLDRAKELADRLMPAFGTSTGLATKMVNLSTGKTGGGSTSVLSELGTLQLEFRYLSRELGDEQYANKAMRAFDFLAGRTVPHGLYPIRINSNTGKFTSSQVTFGALGDSFYEYLLKVWMQGGRREDSYRRMYDDAMDGVDELLVQKARGLTYLSEWNGTTRQQQHKMDHLACFMAGNLALGSMTSQDPVRAARDLRTGKALAYTCYQMYLRTATGLSPEIVEFNGHGDMRPRDKDRFYILRPETLESFFVLHQLTGDPVYREWGWEIFRAIERHCRVGVGYGSHPDVENPSREPDDHMESFFPGETLKYLYLLMQPDHPIDLMEFTFNTEAHPLKIFSLDGARGGGQILI